MKHESTYKIAFGCLLAIVLIIVAMSGISASMLFCYAMLMIVVYVLVSLAVRKLKKFLMEVVEDIKSK
mgnify:CR=1 FL=1